MILYIYVYMRVNIPTYIYIINILLYIYIWFEPYRLYILCIFIPLSSIGDVPACSK